MASDGFLMDKPTWGQRIKRYRLKMGLTQVQLAEELETDPATIARWESRDARPYSPLAESFMVLEAEAEMGEPS